MKTGEENTRFRRTGFGEANCSHELNASRIGLNPLRSITPDTVSLVSTSRY
jgi:hypothetical protein